MHASSTILRSFGRLLSDNQFCTYVRSTYNERTISLILSGIVNYYYVLLSTLLLARFFSGIKLTDGLTRWKKNKIKHVDL